MLETEATTIIDTKELAKLCALKTELLAALGRCLPSVSEDWARARALGHQDIERHVKDILEQAQAAIAKTERATP